MNRLLLLHKNLTTHPPQTIYEHLLIGGLKPLSFLYGAVVRLRVLLYRSGLKKSYRAHVPVISVGNLTTGGTGKTPMVDYLAKQLIGKGIKCAVVSRGYGGGYAARVARIAGEDGDIKMTPSECGDEPFLLARRNPEVAVYVSRKRKQGVSRAERDGAQVVILDDGFQHLAVARDLNLLLIDADRPFGNGYVLPAGTLREPIEAIRRSDLVILTRVTQDADFALPIDLPTLRSRHQLSSILRDQAGNQLDLGDVTDQRCLAFAGIAKPETFFSALRRAGLQNVTEFPLEDHQEYSEDLLKRLRKACHNHDLMITTEKDAVKLSTANFPLPCYSVGVDLVFEETECLDNLINQTVEKNL